MWWGDTLVMYAVSISQLFSIKVTIKKKENSNPSPKYKYSLLFDF